MFGLLSPGWKEISKGRTIQVCPNAELHDDFRSGGKKLIPMVHCHGAAYGADEFTSLPMQIASHGYLVIGLDFMEGHAPYTTGKNGEDIFHDSVYGYFKVPQKG